MPLRRKEKGGSRLRASKKEKYPKSHNNHLPKSPKQLGHNKRRALLLRVARALKWSSVPRP